MDIFSCVLNISTNINFGTIDSAPQEFTPLYFFNNILNGPKLIRHAQLSQAINNWLGHYLVRTYKVVCHECA